MIADAAATPTNYTTQRRRPGMVRPRSSTNSCMKLTAVAYGWLLAGVKGYLVCPHPTAARSTWRELSGGRCAGGSCSSIVRMAHSVKMRSAKKLGALSVGGMSSTAAVAVAEARRRRSTREAGSAKAAHDAIRPFLSQEGASESATAAKLFMFDELGRAELLSHDQEVVLGKKIQQLMAMESLRDQLQAALRRPPTDDEWAEACGYPADQRRLFRDAYRERLRAKHAMVSSNMRLVIAVAKRYGRMGVPLSDLVQEGSLGLIRAAEKYDPDKGFRFSTYAAWWIQQAIYKAIAYHSRTIRLPVHVHNLLYSVRRARKALVLELGRTPTEAELAVRVGMPQDRLRRYLRASRTTISTECPSGKPGFNPQDQVLGDTLEARDTVAPEDCAERGLFRTRLREVMGALPEEERRVVTLRFGLEDGRTRSLAEVACASRCSKEWVRRTESRALRKLRAPHHQQRLQQFLEAMPGRNNGDATIVHSRPR